MRIALISAKIEDCQVARQLQQIKYYLRHVDADLLCFGESFLQGMDGIRFQYEHDRQIALTVDAQPIQQLQTLAKNEGKALSFGMIEREGKTLYSVNLVIDKNGAIINRYRRQSVGWKTKEADAHYMEGENFIPFSLEGKRLAVAICGDLWHDEILERTKLLQLDALLWPLYIDYSPTDWETEQYEYAARAAQLPYPVLLINSYSEYASAAKGGACHFQNGVIAARSPLGGIGILEVEI